MKNSEIYKRLYKDYSKRFINKILISVFFGVLVAASTSSIAWLLDPAIKKIFVEKDQSLIIIIPLFIYNIGFYSQRTRTLPCKSNHD